MEVDYTADFDEKELKMYRNYMNSKIDIFQSNDGYVFRNKNVTQKFYESFEHIQMQNNAAKILSSASNQMLYTLAKDLDGLEATQKIMKKAFVQHIVPGHENDRDYVESQHLQFKKNIMRKKLENDYEYQQLCDFIENPRFGEAMVGNRAFLRYILNHKYLNYHPKYEEIKEKYQKYLCPVFSGGNNPSSSSDNNTSENVGNNDNEEDEEMEG